MTAKSKLVALLLTISGETTRYVRLCCDTDGKRYIRYAFADGCPENCQALPAWTSELVPGEVYEVSGWTGDHWAINGSTPVDTAALMEKKYMLSANDITSIMQQIENGS